MKIAILLRGQSRFLEVSKKFHDDYFTKYYPDIEVKYFYASYLTTTSYENVHIPKYLNIDFLDKDKEEERIHNLLNPASHMFISEKSLQDVCNEIISINDSDIAYKDYIKLSFKKSRIDEMIETSFLVPNVVIENNELIDSHNELKQTHTRLITHYVMGQMYSFLETYKLYSDYVSQNNWKPDLVISTRTDVATLFDTEIFDLPRIARTIYHNGIITRKVKGMLGRNSVHDYTFILSPDNLTSIMKNFKSADDWLISSFTQNKLMLSTILPFTQSYQQSLWSFLLKRAVFINLPLYHYMESIIRSNDYIKLDDSSLHARMKSFDQYSQTQEEFTFNREFKHTWKSYPDLAQELYIKYSNN